MIDESSASLSPRPPDACRAKNVDQSRCWNVRNVDLFRMRHRRTGETQELRLCSTHRRLMCRRGWEVVERLSRAKSVAGKRRLLYRGVA